MNTVIILLSFMYIMYLLYESHENKRIRKGFAHIIHVNGTRGKSSTSRLIEAALRGGEYKVFCKTTGSSPRIIDTFGREKPIKRWGSANIKEQIGILREAAKEKADIVVIECMAVRPELQYISQNKILDGDISVVTNVRRDHLEEMGPTLRDVAIALGNVMPRNGHFITAEKKFIDYYKDLGKEMNTEVHLSEELDDDYGIDFKENVSIALEVCKILQIDKNIAIEKMRNYKKDPGVLSTYKLNTETPNDILFVNGFAINDPDSILMVYDTLKEKEVFKDKDLILLVNNRGDRGYRVKQHIQVILQIKPDRVWISGSYKKFMKKDIIKNGFSENEVLLLKDYKLEEVNFVQRDTVIFAIGNIVGYGDKILDHIKEIGEENV